MNCLATLNLGEYLSQNARQSFLSACGRWGVDYVEIRTPFRKDLNPCFTKLAIFERITGYDRVVYFDADMLIRIDAPSPFSYLDSEKFCAVKDLSAKRFPPGSFVHTEVQNEAHIPWYFILDKQFRLRVPRERYLANFFNAGFFCCDPRRFKGVFDFVVKNIPKEGTPYVDKGRYEQALFNYAVSAFGDLLLVDEQWNFISPALDSGRMQAWVYHFTGWGFSHLKAQVATYDWR